MENAICKWMVYSGKILLKWMMTGGTPLLFFSGLDYPMFFRIWDTFSSPRMAGALARSPNEIPCVSNDYPMIVQ